MTDGVELFNMIFQHMFLSDKTDIDRSAGAFSQRPRCDDIFKRKLTLMKSFQCNFSRTTGKVVKAKRNGVTLYKQVKL